MATYQLNYGGQTYQLDWGGNSAPTEADLAQLLHGSSSGTSTTTSPAPSTPSWVPPAVQEDAAKFQGIRHAGTPDANGISRYTFNSGAVQSYDKDFKRLDGGARNAQQSGANNQPTFGQDFAASAKEDVRGIQDWLRKTGQNVADSLRNAGPSLSTGEGFSVDGGMGVPDLNQHEGPLYNAQRNINNYSATIAGNAAKIPFNVAAAVPDAANLVGTGASAISAGVAQGGAKLVGQNQFADEMGQRKNEFLDSTEKQFDNLTLAMAGGENGAVVNALVGVKALQQNKPQIAKQFLKDAATQEGVGLLKDPASAYLTFEGLGGVWHMADMLAAKSTVAISERMAKSFDAAADLADSQGQHSTANAARAKAAELRSVNGKINNLMAAAKSRGVLADTKDTLANPDRETFGQGADEPNKATTFTVDNGQATPVTNPFKPTEGEGFVMPGRPQTSTFTAQAPQGIGGSVVGGPKPTPPTYEVVDAFAKPSAKGPQADPELQAAANAYNKSVGLPEMPDNQPYAKVDPRAHDIADAYEAMEHNPNDPAVKASYDALKNEISAQWHYATQQMGITFEPWKGEGQPYANSKEMMADVRDNKHLWFFQGGEMPVDHPLAEVDPKTGLTYNDELRAVHDLFGHATNGYEFGPRGEENAWIKHSQMFSEDAIPALTTETKGQNSWVNNGPHLRDEQGIIPGKGHPDYIAPQDRPYAEQKAALLPSEFWKREDLADAQGTHVPGSVGGRGAADAASEAHGPGGMGSSSAAPEAQAGAAAAAADAGAAARSPIVGPDHAQAVEAAVKGDFEPVEPNEFADQIKKNKSSATLSQYSPEELAAMQLYGLARHDIYYALNPVEEHFATGQPETDVVSVMNNGKGRPGVATPAVMLHAIENGATTLDAWDVPTAKANLPDRYARFGFKEIARLPYDEESYGPPSEALTDSWRKDGWKDGDPYPEVSVMKYGGIDGTEAPPRDQARNNYLETGSVYGRGADAPWRVGLPAETGGRGEVQGEPAPQSSNDSFTKALNHLRSLSDVELRGLGVDPAVIREHAPTPAASSPSKPTGEPTPEPASAPTPAPAKAKPAKPQKDMAGTVNLDRMQLAESAKARLRERAKELGISGDDQKPLTNEETREGARKLGLTIDDLKVIPKGEKPAEVSGAIWSVAVRNLHNFWEAERDVRAEEFAHEPTPANEKALEEAEANARLAHEHNAPFKRDAAQVVQSGNIESWSEKGEARKDALKTWQQLNQSAVDAAKEAPKEKEPVRGEAPKNVVDRTARKGYGKSNKIISHDEMTAELGKIKDWIKENAGRANAGFDPTVVPSLVKVGMYHLEAGLRSFGEWVGAMRKTTGIDATEGQWQKIWAQTKADLRDSISRQRKQLTQTIFADNIARKLGSRRAAANWFDEIDHDGQSTIVDKIISGRELTAEEQKIVRDATEKHMERGKVPPSTDAMKTVNDIIEANRRETRKRTQAASREKQTGSKAPNATQEKAPPTPQEQFKKAVSRGLGKNTDAFFSEMEGNNSKVLDKIHAGEDLTPTDKRTLGDTYLKHMPEPNKPAAATGVSAVLRDAVDGARRAAKEAERSAKLNDPEYQFRRSVQPGLRKNTDTFIAHVKANMPDVYQKILKGQDLSEIEQQRLGDAYLQHTPAPVKGPEAEGIRKSVGDAVDAARTAAREAEKAAKAAVNATPEGQFRRNLVQRVGKANAEKVLQDLGSDAIGQSAKSKLLSGQDLSRQEAYRLGRALEKFRRATTKAEVPDLVRTMRQVVSDTRKGRLGYDSPKLYAKKLIEDLAVKPDKTVDHDLIDKFNRELAHIPEDDHPAIANLVMKYHANALDNLGHYIMSNLLSGFKTLLKIAESHPTQVMAEELRRAVMDPAGSRQGVSAGFGALKDHGLAEAGYLAKHGKGALELQGKVPSHEMGRQITQEFTTKSAAANNAVRIVMRVHGALYHLFEVFCFERGLVYHAREMAHAEGLKGDAFDNRVSQLLTDRPAALTKKAVEFAEEEKLTNKTLLEAPIEAMKKNPVGKFVANVFIPIARLPLNLLGRTVEMATGAVMAPAYARILKATNKEITPAELAAYRQKVFARGLVGLGIAYGGYLLQQHGAATAPEPSKGIPGKLHTPLGDVNTSQLGPVSNMFNLGTTLGDMKDRASAPNQLPVPPMKTALSNTKRIVDIGSDNPYKSISDTTGPIESLDMREVNRRAAGLTNEFVPFSAQWAQDAATMDPYVRGGMEGGPKQSYGDYMKNSYGISRGTLPPLNNQLTQQPYRQENMLGVTAPTRPLTPVQTAMQQAMDLKRQLGDNALYTLQRGKQGDIDKDTGLGRTEYEYTRRLNYYVRAFRSDPQSITPADLADIQDTIRQIVKLRRQRLALR